METTAKTLQGMKVPELKAKCKELKIPNFSKLSKADLIAKLLEAGGTTTIDLPARAPASKSAKRSADSSVVNVSQAPDSTAAITSTKEGKADKPTSKREASDEGGPKKKAKSSAKSKVQDAASRATTPPSIPGGATSTLITAILTGPDKPSTPTTAPSAQAQAQEIRPVASKPTKSKAAIAKPSQKSKASLMNVSNTSKTQPQQGAEDTAAATTNKTKPRARPSSIQQVKARPRFTGLIQTKTPQLAPRLPDIPACDQLQLESPADRIKYIESHFLNTLFILLHKYRAKSITGPQYPCPPSFAKSPSYKLTAHLAFQGFHPDLYSKPTSEGFKVALRFWMARLHSYMQLGSGEAWSSNAKEMGILGPDLATWPPVLSVQQVTEEIWGVKTEEEGEIVKYLVIGEMGEVVGSSKTKTGEDAIGEDLTYGCGMRGDWAKYLAGPAETRKKLGTMVKTKDSYGFPNGISSAWSAGAGRAQHLSRVAHRAVMASCALNSFSGEKLSSLAMDAAYLGRPATGGNILDDLDLYLPESSQVLSVHMPTNLHPALAIVHRSSGYSEFVLAETGQVVGMEDEGIVNLWQGLIGCNDKGAAESSGQAVFWKGWESRMKFIG